MQAERILKNVGDVYRVLKEGCDHYNNYNSIPHICLACRLEIFSEMKRLHELEDSLEDGSGTKIHSR